MHRSSSLFRPFALAAFAAVVITVIAAGPARAQTGTALVNKPWPGDTTLQLGVNVWAFAETDVEDFDDEVNLIRIESAGRFRLNPAPNANGDQVDLMHMEAPADGVVPASDDVRFGYELLHLDIDSDLVSEGLTDLSIAGSWMRTLEPGRRIGAVVGVGYAGDSPFGDSEAYYFMAHVIFEQALDEQSKLVFTLAYNGNRTLWPDVPLPMVAYSRRVNDQLAFTVGLPYSTVYWQPADRWTITAVYAPVYSLDVRADYELHEDWRLFAQFDSDYDAFVIGDDDDRRAFVSQRRIEIGASYLPTDQLEFTLAVGYAFDQSIDTGWDARDTDEVVEFDDTPFIRAAVDVMF